MGGPGPLSTISTLWVLGLVVVVLVGLGAARSHRMRTDSRDRDAAPATTDRSVSNEEHVLALLQAHDGRMRQTAIVEATGWSKAKVSLLLAELDEEGQVTKIRVGRENLIALPGEEPAAAQAPFSGE